MLTALTSLTAILALWAISVKVSCLWFAGRVNVIWKGTRRCFTRRSLLWPNWRHYTSVFTTKLANHLTSMTQSSWIFCISLPSCDARSGCDQQRKQWVVPHIHVNTFNAEMIWHKDFSTNCSQHWERTGRGLKNKHSAPKTEKFKLYLQRSYSCSPEVTVTYLWLLNKVIDYFLHLQKLQFMCQNKFSCYRWQIIITHISGIKMSPHLLAPGRL